MPSAHDCRRRWWGADTTGASGAVRETGEVELEPVQMGCEVIGTPPTSMLLLVARFGLREALGFRYDPEKPDEMFGTVDA